jgi:hypothetical protein
VRSRLNITIALVACTIAAVALSACADSRPAAPPPPVSVSLLITLNKWSWILDGDRQRHPGGGGGRPQAGTPHPDHPSAGADEVTVEIGYGEMVYDSCPIERFVEKATIQAGLGVRNWIRIRDGERTIEVGSVAGRKGAGLIIELGPGISTSEY